MVLTYFIYVSLLRSASTKAKHKKTKYHCEVTCSVYPKIGYDKVLWIESSAKL